MAATEATLADIDALRAFLLEAWEKAGPGALGWTGATADNIQEISSEAYIKGLISDANLRVFVFKEDGKVMGFVVNRALDTSRVELAGIIVLQDAVGKGIGSKLFEKARNEAVKAGFKTLLVKTEAFNKRAISFYERRGFIQTGRRAEHIEGIGVELILLELGL